MPWWDLVVVAFGLLFLGAAVRNWEWFWTRGRQRLGAQLFGRTAARVLYGAVGLAAIITGILSALGLLWR